MQIQFGNLSVLAFENKTQVEFSDKDFKWLNEHHTDKADFKEDDKFHIFALPLGIVAGHKVGKKLLTRLKKYPFQKHFYVETKESGT